LNSLTLVTIITDYKDADEYHLWYLSASLYRTSKMHHLPTYPHTDFMYRSRRDFFSRNGVQVWNQMARWLIVTTRY